MNKVFGWLIIAVCLSSGFSYSQSINISPSTTHVFPQSIDGTLRDGSAWQTMLWIDNTNSTGTSCQILGPLSTRFDEQTFLLPRSTSTNRGTLAQSTLISGFVQLNCSLPVSASLTYISFSPGGDVSGMATVLPGRAITQSFLQHTSWARFGVAIANTNSSTLNLEARFNGANGQSTVRTITVAPMTQYVKFVDEILDLSPTTRNGLFSLSNVQSNTPFYITGLMFIGSAFTTLLPGGFSAATQPAGVNLCTSLEGSSIVATDGQFLGKITSNKFDSQSIGNEFGVYGSKFSSTSIFNEFGTYGSAFSAKSAFNDLATSPPSIFVSGQSIGFLTTNQLKTPRVDTWAVVACVK
jgi:hypothetical protein